MIDQRSTIGKISRVERPVHGACVVPGCWCGSTTRGSTTTGSTTTARTRSFAVARTVAESVTTRRSDAASGNLTNIAWRSVGLPVA